MIVVACLGFWLFGVTVGAWVAWTWRELKDDELV